MSTLFSSRSYLYVHNPSFLLHIPIGRATFTRRGDFCGLAFSNDFDSNIQILVDAAGRLLSASWASYERLGSSTVHPVALWQAPNSLFRDRPLWRMRTIAQGGNAGNTKLRDICSASPATLSPDDSVDKAISLMRQKAVRRIPIVENDRPVGIVSLGDLALSEDRQSALGEISAAQPNR